MSSIAQVDSILKNAVYTKRIGFITISIEEVEPGISYEIYTVTEKHGKQFIGSESSIEDAQWIVEQEEQSIIKRMSKRRKGTPTARQLSTLFSLKIPIAINLTFGEASDLLDIALTEKRNARREKIRLLK
jgi:hypothetical protein